MDKKTYFESRFVPRCFSYVNKQIFFYWKLCFSGLAPDFFFMKNGVQVDLKRGLKNLE